MSRNVFFVAVCVRQFHALATFKKWVINAYFSLVCINKDCKNENYSHSPLELGVGENFRITLKFSTLPSTVTVPPSSSFPSSSWTDRYALREYNTGQSTQNHISARPCASIALTLCKLHRCSPWHSRLPKT